MAAPIMGDATVPARGQKEHLVLEGIGAERPSVTEDDRLPFAPILVVDLRAVFGDYRRHVTLPPEQVCRVALADSAYTHPCALTILSPANFAVNVSRERSPSLRDIAGHSPLMALSARSYRRSDDTERTFPSTEFRGHRRSRFATFTTTVLWTRLFGLKSVDQDLGGRAGRGRVLAGNEQPVEHHVAFPVLDLGEDGAESEQLVFDQERNDLSKADIRLLTDRK